MTCKEPACPWPSAREGYCTAHWKLRYGTREDLMMGPSIPPDAGPKWDPGLAAPIQPGQFKRRPMTLRQPKFNPLKQAFGRLTNHAGKTDLLDTQPKSSSRRGAEAMLRAKGLR
jgi:hypothetical protein